MKQIKVIKTGIDVSKILKQLEEHPEDWGSQQRLDNVRVKDPHEYITTVDVLQLVMGSIERPGEDVGNTETCHNTPAYEKHTEVIKYLSQYFPDIRRCAFLALPVGEIVGAHIDEGTYYLDKDRYHLSLQGQYKYFVGTESIVVDPGTFLWFNNKIPHGTVNIGDDVRLAFVFDVPHSPNNPQHKLN
jgi:hypothetical protein